MPTKQLCLCPFYFSFRLNSYFSSYYCIPWTLIVSGGVCRKLCRNTRRLVIRFVHSRSPIDFDCCNKRVMAKTIVLFYWHCTYLIYITFAAVNILHDINTIYYYIIFHIWRVDIILYLYTLLSIYIYIYIVHYFTLLYHQRLIFQDSLMISNQSIFLVFYDLLFLRLYCVRV